MAKGILSVLISTAGAWSASVTPVDRAVDVAAISAEVALQLTGGVVEVSPSALAASAVGRECAQLAGIGVLGKGESDDAAQCGGEQERSQRAEDLGGGGPAGEERVTQRRGGEDRVRGRPQARLVVGAVRADALGAGLDALDPEPPLGDARDDRGEAVEVKQAQTDAAAKLGVGGGVGLVADRLGQPERRPSSVNSAKVA